MQKYIIYIFIITFLSACSYGTYELNKGPLNIATKASYNVTYKVLASSNATITFTDESGNQKTLENISGKWEKSIDIKSGHKVQFTVDSKDKQLASVLVDQKPISTIDKTNKTAHYSLSFVLP
ncbi:MULTISPECIES: hypothetical protein [unclassified Pedobacter]|uniref:hypothetical protein n=1 Tax=unclassified Pedobacter TaxID=2628915 RepID=UPI001422722C|nr:MULTISPECIES: hypothetical protein [unclassified Pedobacter]NII84234.1 hypothetical protein [Pedobacter sp. SG908]NMN38851.1 hypothetical protein [Pedobacter sp. SG918]